MSQIPNGGLFSVELREPFRDARPIDPNVHAEDVPRLTGQNAAILDRLRSGPATNKELARLSLKYTSRLSDARAAGYQIVCKRLSGGLTEYRLVDNRQPS